MFQQSISLILRIDQLPKKCIFFFIHHYFKVNKFEGLYILQSCRATHMHVVIELEECTAADPSSSRRFSCSLSSRVSVSEITSLKYYIWRRDCSRKLFFVILNVQVSFSCVPQSQGRVTPSRTMSNRWSPGGSLPLSS